jgi:hypothetical protein
MYGSAKTAMRNVANGVKEWKLRWDWEPAGDALTAFFTATVLFAAFGGTPEQSKGQKDGSLHAQKGRVLGVEELTAAAGIYRPLTLLTYCRNRRTVPLRMCPIEGISSRS